MFTGLIQSIGTLTDLTPSDTGVRIRVECPAIVARVQLGDSVAVNGICLTVSSLGDGALRFDEVRQTLDRTTLRT